MAGAGNLSGAVEQILALRHSPDTVKRIYGWNHGPRLLRETVGLSALAEAFPLPWSAYVRLLSVRNELARQFYETEALRGGWSVRQLERQINRQFYERTALSRKRAAMLEKAGQIAGGDVLTRKPSRTRLSSNSLI